METAIVASDNVTISISLIWTVMGSLVSALGVAGTVIGILYNRSREDQKLFSQTILEYTSQLIKVTMENTASHKEQSASNQLLTKAVQELPEKVMMMMRK